MFLFLRLRRWVSDKAFQRQEACMPGNGAATMFQSLQRLVRQILKFRSLGISGTGYLLASSIVNAPPKESIAHLNKTLPKELQVC